MRDFLEKPFKEAIQAVQEGLKDYCLNPGCKLQVPPKKHGFYQRNSLDGEFASKIFIRRYRCTYCGMTFSFLPSFCLPYYQ
jgi:transposase-like protein